MPADDSNQPSPDVFEKRSIAIHVGAVAAAYAINGMPVSCRIHLVRASDKDKRIWKGGVGGPPPDGIAFAGGIAESIWCDFPDDESSDIEDVSIEDLDGCLGLFLSLSDSDYDSQLTIDTFDTFYRIRGLVKVIVDALITKQSLSVTEVEDLCGNWVRDAGYVPPDA